MKLQTLKYIWFLLRVELADAITNNGISRNGAHIPALNEMIKEVEKEVWPAEYESTNTIS